MSRRDGHREQTAADLLPWTQTTLLIDEPDLARAGWKAICPGTPPPASPAAADAPSCLQVGWPWALALARAFHALRAMPVPA